MRSNTANKMGHSKTMKEYYAGKKGENTRRRTTREAKQIWSKIWEQRYYLPTPPLGQDMTQGQFLSGV